MKSFNRFAALSTVSALASLLAACGGGGGGGSGGGGGGGGGSSYTVGGSMSGLAGAGLVLLDNGGDALNVQPSSASFTFATAVASGKGYSVTIQTQPSGQSCNVTNASGTVGSANINNVAVSCAFTASGANQTAVSVNPGPASAGSQTFNDVLTSVTICVPSTNTCATISNVLVDTGSSGLRLMKSVLTSAGLTLTPNPDPNVPGNTIFECFQFADGFTWGAVANADVKISSETASSIPVQVIDDTGGSTPPTNCSDTGGSLNSVNAFDSNGTLGVGQFVQDCGTACENSAGNNVYYSCSVSCPLTATSTTLALADQVVNPVSSFATDNNGVIVQLPSIAATGAATASGALVFGIGTESDNNLGAVTIIITNSGGNFTTSFNGQTLGNSFIDSGSNALFFPAGNNSPLTVCADASSFYCPGSSSSISTQNLNATNQGANGTMSNVAFQIANVDYLSANYGGNFALNDVGGPAAPSQSLTDYFDWGVPFFYGRSIYIAIEGMSAGGTTGPYNAY